MCLEEICSLSNNSPVALASQEISFTPGIAIFTGKCVVCCVGTYPIGGVVIRQNIIMLNCWPINIIFSLHPMLPIHTYTHTCSGVESSGARY